MWFCAKFSEKFPKPLQKSPEKVSKNAFFCPFFHKKQPLNNFFHIDNQPDSEKMQKKFQKVLPEKKKVVLLQSQNERNGARGKGRCFGKFFERME